VGVGKVTPEGRLVIFSSKSLRALQDSCRTFRVAASQQHLAEPSVHVPAPRFDLTGRDQQLLRIAEPIGGHVHPSDGNEHGGALLVGFGHAPADFFDERPLPGLSEVLTDRNRGAFVGSLLPRFQKLVERNTHAKR
jgi:hypothetical protein